ncbi:MAG: hypothetical protein KFF49_12415 [Bacteroidales bacterium]|nr:hypothetical protein [Bacteroidales bacterium]
MKYLLKIFLSLIIFSALFIGSCKKQAKCGCDGDIINELLGFPIYLYHDTINNQAQFTSVSNPYTTYYVCNPSAFMSQMKKYEYGALVLVDGHLYWNCNYMMQASNNSYYSYMYKAYDVELTDIYEDLYGK